MSEQHKKQRVALMTYAVDGRKAKGTAIVARKCVEAFLAARDEFDLTFIHYEESNDAIYGHGVREVIFPGFRIGFLNRRFIRQIWYFLTTKDRYDVVQWFQPRLYPFFWFAPTRYVVATLHGAGDLGKENPFDLMRHIFNWTLRLWNRRVDVAIAGSDFARKDIIRQYGFRPEQVHVVHNGVDAMFVRADAAAIERVREKYALPEHFFLNVARLNPGKNAFRTIQAFDRFARASTDTGIHFVNVGAHGTDESLVKEFIEKSRVKDRMHLVEYVDTEDLPAVYSAALALVFPLLNEGFGLPLLEAMACGTPVIASETSYPEIGKDEAILVDALSEEDIARGMTLMHADEQLRATLVKNGLAAAKKYSWDASVGGVLALYRTLK